MEKIVQQSLYYDFYGELLNEHQKSIYEDAVFHDLSLGEIAQERSISRQGVHDMIRRCDRILAGYEEKLHLIERFQKTKEDVERIRQHAKTLTPENVQDKQKEILLLAARILEEL